MALTGDDKKWITGAIRDGMVEALEQVVFPEFMRIEKKMATKDDLNRVEENLSRRVDKVAEIVTDTRTNHERRIRRLENEAGVVPEVRLI
ncbi:hypothetical protein A3A84_00040 [Candidatus Collierbacteria bacterium RIFCSPLOWO2_01_FULL_50_23]|uniref:Uncharacterized protein n=1 Tax=Candidatus Collierbacteria bacterium RIFCSPHIGHO2_02_FULL_49_10 TaxID=1817723 RepID=A0A1F5EU31_9BACT|nr:MAG: hypothetical protein A3D09_04085 [Candidatus Collierbacteria bacterium RIFCSPHIGHO2_02_FULL_49_10]OGD74195.1 MAG: hypothetical protein A3A84_00040 [Candidatus Collierbacteria bacterium RIFCSPLOWO2_01_FULL_50_23]